MPNAFGNINCRALCNGRAGIANYAEAGAIQDEQNLIGSVMPMDSNADTDRHLLRSQGHAL
jgi:hypothetical protein